MTLIPSEFTIGEVYLPPFLVAALLAVAAYDGVTARLENAQCTGAGAEGDSLLVSCTGSIIATYSGEDRPLPLDRVQYVTVNEGGDWRMCGYK